MKYFVDTELLFTGSGEHRRSREKFDAKSQAQAYAVSCVNNVFRVQDPETAARVVSLYEAGSLPSTLRFTSEESVLTIWVTDEDHSASDDAWLDS